MLSYELRNENEQPQRFNSLKSAELAIKGAKFEAIMKLYAVDVVNASEEKICGLVYHPSWGWQIVGHMTETNGVVVDRLKKYNLSFEDIK